MPRPSHSDEPDDDGDGRHPTEPGPRRTRLDGRRKVSAHSGRDTATDQRSWPRLALGLIGNDHHDVVEVSAVLSRHGLGVNTIAAGTGGRRRREPRRG